MQAKLFVPYVGCGSLHGMPRYPALMSTTQAGRILGKSSASVATYVRQGLLRALVHSPRLILITGEDLAEFQRDVFPLIRRGRGNKYPKRPRRRRG